MRKLYRIEEGKMLFGVCNGIAAYFNIDVTLVRLIWAVFTILGGSGILFYMLAAVIMPVQPY